MDLTPVTSSNVAAVGHDPKTATLRVRFNNGRTYDYAGVPANVAAQMMAAESVGKFLNSVIKPAYAATQVTDG